GAESRLHGFRHDIHAPEQGAPSFFIELQLLRHGSFASLECDGETELLEDGEDVFLAQDQVVLAVDLDLVAGVLAKQDPIAALHVERDALAVVGDLAGADGLDLPALRLLLGGVRDDDPADLLLALFLALDEDTVV